MALIVGLLLVLLGVVALVAWFPAVLVFLQGLTVFSLLLWGTLSLVVGIAGWRGKRQIKTALNDDTGDTQNSE